MTSGGTNTSVTFKNLKFNGYRVYDVDDNIYTNSNINNVCIKCTNSNNYLLDIRGILNADNIMAGNIYLSNIFISSNSAQINNNLLVNKSISIGGFVNTTVSSYNLFVYKDTKSDTLKIRYFSTTSDNTSISRTSINSTSIKDFCAYFDSSLICAGNIAAVSDRRIKTDIIDINDGSALQQLLLIQPKTYKYINFIERGSDTVYGFIAQQIKEVFPNAVKIITDYIPNVYKKYTLSNNIIITNEDLTNLLSNNDKIQIIEKYSGTKNNYEILEISSNYIKIDKSINGDECFIYGKEVNDFHTLTKDYIYTLNACATQDIYRIIQNQKTKLEQIKLTMAQQRERINQIKIKAGYLGLSNLI